MSGTVQFPNGTDYRRELKRTDAFLIQDITDLTKKPERTSLGDIKTDFTGEISEGNTGFVEGGAVFGQLSGLEKLLSDMDMSGVSNRDNVPLLSNKYMLSDLLRTDVALLNTLRYNCCLAASYLPDFPPELAETDSMGYVFTNRNEKFGVQLLVGAETGGLFTRRLNYGKMTEWTPVQGDTIYYATFDIIPETGELIMLTAPGYAGVDFILEEGELFVNV